LLAEIKMGLRREGWKMVVDQAPRVITGTVGGQTRLEAADTFHTRYRLHVAETRVDLGFTGGPTVVNNLSLIDNNTGAEAIAMIGSNCASWVAGKFPKAIGADTGR
jgi:hypothetical protein